jgi:hypothetical protein
MQKASFFKRLFASAFLIAASFYRRANLHSTYFKPRHLTGGI